MSSIGTQSKDAMQDLVETLVHFDSFPGITVADPTLCEPGSNIDLWRWNYFIGRISRRSADLRIVAATCNCENGEVRTVLGLKFDCKENIPERFPLRYRDKEPTEHDRDIRSESGKIFVGLKENYKAARKNNENCLPVVLTKSSAYGNVLPTWIGEMIAFNLKGNNLNWEEHIDSLTVELALDGSKVAPADAVNTVLKNFNCSVLEKCEK